MPMTVSMNIRFCCHQNCRKYCSDNRLEDNRLTGMCPYMRTNIPFICIYDAYRRPVRRSVAPLQRYAETRPESRDDTSIYYNRYATLRAYGDKKASRTDTVREALLQRRRLPTLPHCIAVPSAQVGLTSLFGMGRGGTPPP